MNKGNLDLLHRGVALGFAARSKKNLEHIESAFEGGHDVHLVTQIVQSMFGLVVFAWETDDSMALWKYRVADLADQEGWPRWQITKGHADSKTLNGLVPRIRHAFAHANIKFSSDEREPERVHITLWNMNKAGTAKTWQGSIQADELAEFCKRFADLLTRLAHNTPQWG